MVDANSVACCKWHTHVFSPMLETICVRQLHLACDVFGASSLHHDNQVRTQPRRREPQDSQDPDFSFQDIWTARHFSHHLWFCLLKVSRLMKDSSPIQGPISSSKSLLQVVWMEQQEGLAIYAHTQSNMTYAIICLCTHSNMTYAKDELNRCLR